MRFCVQSPLALVAVMMLFTAAGCQGCAPAPPPDAIPPGELCGTGTIDGADYTVDAAHSQLVVVVKRKDAFGCGALHSHAVRAGQAVLTYTLDKTALSDGTLTMTVPAAGLQPDAPELRTAFLQGFGGEVVLTPDNIQSIKGSIREEVLADAHPDLTFTVSGLSASDGAGSATLTSSIAGQDSDTTLNYTASKTGDGYAVTGDGVIDGTRHGMPRLSLGFCVDEHIEVHFTLAFIAGTTTCDALDHGVNPERTFYDDTTCASNVGFNAARDVLGPRCMGCHLDPPRAGATVPLITWEDYRTDSIRNPGHALYETAHAYINTDPAVALSMPPSEYTQLAADELALLNTWIVDDHGTNARCADDAGPTLFERTAHVGCANAPSVSFDDADGNGNSARAFFDNNCMYCHGDAAYAPAAPQVGVFDGATFTGTYDFAAAAAPGSHPYYADAQGPLSFWEMAVLRVNDRSMFPSGGAEQDPSFVQFTAWVQAGFTETCP